MGAFFVFFKRTFRALSRGCHFLFYFPAFLLDPSIESAKILRHYACYPHVSVASVAPLGASDSTGAREPPVFFALAGTENQVGVPHRVHCHHWQLTINHDSCSRQNVSDTCLRIARGMVREQHNFTSL